MGINKLINGFTKKAAAPHYEQILGVYNAAKELMGAGAMVDVDLKALTKAIGQSAARLLYNADNFGVSAQTSARYHEQLLSGVESVIKNLQANHDFLNDENYKNVAIAANSAKEALDNYLPVYIPAQRPGEVQVGQDTIKGKPSLKGRKPGDSWYQVPSALPTADNSETIKSVHPSVETVPGPNGERIPAVSVPEETGVAYEKPFNWNKGVQGPAQTAPNVPATGRDEELEPWMMADDGKTASRISVLKKLAK